MNANEIAQALWDSSRGRGRLSVKQTRWLYDQARREEIERTGKHQRGYAYGTIEVEGETRVWTLRVDPASNEGTFKIASARVAEFLSSLEKGDPHPTVDALKYLVYQQRGWEAERAAYDVRLTDPEIDELAHQAEYWYTRAAIAQEKLS